MFQNTHFVFIGYYKKDSMLRLHDVKDIKKIIGNYKGSITPTISNKTNYVIIPTKFTDKILRNGNLKRVQKYMYNTSLQFVYIAWVLSCIHKKRIVPTDQFIVNSITEHVACLKLDVFSLQKKRNLDIYKDVLFPAIRVYKQYMGYGKRTYYYNVITNVSSYISPYQYEQRKIRTKQDSIQFEHHVHQLRKAVRQRHDNITTHIKNDNSLWKKRKRSFDTVESILEEVSRYKKKRKL